MRDGPDAWRAFRSFVLMSLLVLITAASARRAPPR